MIQSLHPVILILVITNIVITFKGFKDLIFFDNYKFNIFHLKHKEWIRLISSGFLHVDGSHLFLNMLTLYFFGDTVLYSIGVINFIFLYIGSLLLGNLFALYFHVKQNSYSAVGASGAVMGVIFSAILLDPEMKLMFILFPIPLPGYVFGIGYLVYTLFGMKNQNDSIGHTAHFGGAMGGILLTICLKPMVIVNSPYTLTLLIATIAVSGVFLFRK